MSDPKGYLVTPVAFRSDGSLHALELDNSDRLKVIVDSVTGNLIVVQSDPANLRVGDSIWDGSAWQKMKGNASGVQNVIVDSVPSPITIDGNEPSLLKPTPKSSTFSNLALAAGTNILDAVTIPASETWRLTTIAFIVVGAGTISQVYWQINNTVTDLNYNLTSPVVNGQYYFSTVNILLDSSWKIRFTVVGATAGDDFYCFYFTERVY